MTPRRRGGPCTPPTESERAEARAWVDHHRCRLAHSGPCKRENDGVLRVSRAEMARSMGIEPSDLGKLVGTGLPRGWRQILVKLRGSADPEPRKPEVPYPPGATLTGTGD